MMILENKNFTIIRQTQGRIPNLPFVDIKNAILGKNYDLSLIFPKLELATALHIQWKKKDGPVNILSFPLDNESGEMFITLSQARTEAKNFERDYHNHLVFLFIHGCLHLTGMIHGHEMEQAEKKYFSKFEQKK